MGFLLVFFGWVLGMTELTEIYLEMTIDFQPFITAQSQVITAHFVYHCTVFYALGSFKVIENSAVR